jgi:hypothetical protein
MYHRYENRWEGGNQTRLAFSQEPEIGPDVSLPMPYGSPHLQVRWGTAWKSMLL